VLWHPSAYAAKTMAGMKAEIEVAATALKTELIFAGAEGLQDVTSALSFVAAQRPDGFVVFPSPMLYGEYRRIVDMAMTHRLPGIYAAREGVELGGLLSYGVNLADLSRQTAPYIDRILKGAKPTDLPIERPVKFELLINLKSAKTLGIVIPPMLIARADEVID
jgi:putative ABC transport system substrate-binding protein